MDEVFDAQAWLAYVDQGVVTPPTPASTWLKQFLALKEPPPSHRPVRDACSPKVTAQGLLSSEEKGTVN